MKIIKKPVRNPREEMVAFNEGGEEDGRRQELFPLRAGAGRATRHFSASAAQIREGENSSSPSPARFCSSVTQTTGERNLLSALLADPEMNDFGDDTRGSRINAGEASTLRRTKLAQDEKRRSKKKDSNHRDRKVTEREVPFWRGSANDATHQQDTQKEISSRRDCHSSRRNGHSSGTKARRHLSPQLTSSLRDCVKDMGFDPADIETAIESTDAKSSADAARVVEWLAEHRDKPRGSSTGTAFTADSNERVEELHESLKELGFSADYIRRKKELYRRHSSKLGAEEFISAMLEVAASEDSSSSSDESSMEDFASPANISEIAEVTEADKRVLALDDSLRELGYCQELVKERQTSYRQYSNTMKPEDFISAMLEVEDGITATPARDVLPRPHGRG
jgi:Holliday junction resolvasome RuvABC DNA-binding subunit